MHQRRLPLAFSCPQSLDDMPRVSGTERWCTVCRKRVHELSSMRESEARALLRAARKKGRTCVDYRADEHGSVLFRDRPSPGRGRTALALAGLALAVTLGACAGSESLVVTQPDDQTPASTESTLESVRAEPELPEPGRRIEVDGYAGTEVWIYVHAGGLSTPTFRIEREPEPEPPPRRTYELRGDVIKLGTRDSPLGEL
jgi:hypothetical protein